nr:E3 ubiquitin-protein ligase RNF138 [Manis javanica]
MDAAARRDSGAAAPCCGKGSAGGGGTPAQREPDRRADVDSERGGRGPAAVEERGGRRGAATRARSQVRERARRDAAGWGALTSEPAAPRQLQAVRESETEVARRFLARSAPPAARELAPRASGRPGPQRPQVPEAPLGRGPEELRKRGAFVTWQPGRELRSPSGKAFAQPARPDTPRFFCRKCFLTAMRESGIHCPLCRGNVTRRERACPERALDLENVMRKFSGRCRCCAKQIKFYRMRHHYKSCKKYQDEYGVSSIIPNFQISQDSIGNSNRSETSTSDNTETYQENTSSSGQPTFKCPLCQESNFTRQRLLDHCNSEHLFQIVPVTCPICVSLPWGDPSQITRNFVSHLNQRHQFDYGEFVNLQLDEETQYQTAVEESFQANI